jgi:hypothetical protein
MKEGQRIYRAIRDAETREWFVGEAVVERIWKTPKRGYLHADIRAENFTTNGKIRWTKKDVEDFFSTPLAAVENAIWRILRPSPYEAGLLCATIGGSIEEEIRSMDGLFALWRELRRAAK